MYRNLSSKYLKNLDAVPLLKILKRMTAHELLRASQLSTRVKRFAIAAAKLRHELTFLCGDNAEYLPSQALFQPRDHEVLVEHEEDDPEVPLLDEVEMILKNMVYIDNLPPTISLADLTFLNITSLIICISTKPEDLFKMWPILEASAESLVTLKIYAKYRDVSKAELKKPQTIYRHDRLLYLINNKMAKLKKLTLSIGAPVMRTSYTRFNLPILKQLQEFYLSVQTFTNGNQLVENVVRNLVENPGILETQTILGIYPSKPWNMITFEETLSHLGALYQLPEMVQCFRVLHLQICPQDRWILSNSQLLLNLTVLKLTTNVYVNRKEFLNLLQPLSTLRDLRISYEIGFYEMSSDIASTKLHTMPRVVMPAIEHFTLILIPPAIGNDYFDYHDKIEHYQYDLCFPNMRTFKLVAPKIAICRECHLSWIRQRRGDRRDVYRDCFSYLVLPLRLCRKLEKVVVKEQFERIQIDGADHVLSAMMERSMRL